MNTTPFFPPLDDEAPSLVVCLSIVEDVRDLNRRHSLTSILVIAVCCMICGGEGYNDMEDFGEANEDWFRTFLDLENGIPSHDTFNRVFAALDPLRFRECFLKWTKGLRKAAGGDVIALDGKSLRRAANGKSMPHMVSAWSVRNGLVLGQTKVSEKANEITAIPELLDSLNIKGCVVTIDAMGCQKKIAKQIVDKQGDEDYSRARVLNAAENLAVLRHIVLNMLKQETTKKRGIKGKQRNAAWNRSYLMKVLGTQVNLS